MTSSDFSMPNKRNSWLVMSTRKSCMSFSGQHFERPPRLPPVLMPCGKWRYELQINFFRSVVSCKIVRVLSLVWSWTFVLSALAQIVPWKLTLSAICHLQHVYQSFQDLLELYTNWSVHLSKYINWDESYEIENSARSDAVTFCGFLNPFRSVFQPVDLWWEFTTFRIVSLQSQQCCSNSLLTNKY